MRVIAEGIQTREQLEFLRDRRCPEGQGFYFGAPVPVDQVAELLGKQPRFAAAL
jgi:EAL domain-containing protein (putative c-di-GMP-specific phosphodiesterase class I)